MNAVRAAVFVSALTGILMPAASRADQIGLANSSSIQARIEYTWEKTHPMNNQHEPPPKPSNDGCNLVISGSGANRVASCR